MSWVVIPSEVRYNVLDGRLGLEEADNNSSIRGTPEVAFALAVPALWKVFNVNWVVGSPMD